ncbi:MAG: hypothetical protein ACRDND_34275, partial [Streptosporangiaceae bacterium]
AAGTISSARRTAGAHWYQPDGPAAASAGLRLLLCGGIWMVGAGFVTAFPPRGFWILLVVAASAANGVFAVIQEVKLVLWLCRRN